MFKIDPDEKKKKKIHLNAFLEIGCVKKYVVIEEYELQPKLRYGSYPVSDMYSQSKGHFH